MRLNRTVDNRLSPIVLLCYSCRVSLRGSSACFYLRVFACTYVCVTVMTKVNGMCAHAGKAVDFV